MNRVIILGNLRDDLERTKRTLTEAKRIRHELDQKLIILEIEEKEIQEDISKLEKSINLLENSDIDFSSESKGSILK